MEYRNSSIGATMSKVYINPNGIAVMVEAAKTSQELETLLELIKTSAHPYQIGWIKEKIHTLKQQETKK